MVPHARCGPLIPALRGKGSQVSKSEAGQGCTEKLSPKPNKQDRCPKLGGTHLDPQHGEVRAGGTGLKQPQPQNEFNAGDQNQAITFGSEKLFPSHGLTFFFKLHMSPWALSYTHCRRVIVATWNTINACALSRSAE